MSPGLKYALGRLGIFVACAVPTLLLLPKDMNLFLKLMIAFVVSAAISVAVLKRWRDEVAQQMATNSRKRSEQKERLRSALAGDESSSDDHDSRTR